MTAALSLHDAAAVLAEPACIAGLETLSALPEQRVRAWDEVIVERWLPTAAARWDIMGAIASPTTLASRLPSLGTAALARAWLASEQLAASLLWFEWDVHRLGSAAADPLCSVCLCDAVLADAALRRPSPDPQAQAQARARTLRACDREAAIATLERLVAQLADDGELLHIADLSARGRAATRLCFFVRADQILPWLRRCGWRGPASRLGPVLFAACSPFERTAVQLEIDPSGALADYVGIESLEWCTAVPHGQVAAWHRAWLQLGIEAPLPLLARWASWAGAGCTVGPERVDCDGFMFLKTAFDGESWQGKAYLGVRPSG
ncbi:MAG: hypothetical protein IPH07_38075 [Deltaproteobacteria bacterium]|nr:hypothetical protein [Deltaproteobacteria bacterium]MBK8713637.1 hypothetical protein [Deltaproteobacteria bacterium]